MSEETPGTLKPDEFHPSALHAYRWILENHSQDELMMQMEAISSVAISGNRMAEICSETLSRILNNEPVSDRYLLGLAWELMEQKNMDKENG